MHSHTTIHSTIDWTLHTNIGQRTILVAVSIIISFAWIYFTGYNLNCNIDSGSYLSAGNVIFSGHIDNFRTPVYPVICHIATSIFQYNGLYVVAALQLMAFYISIIYVHKAASTFMHNYGCRFLATALYAWSVPIIDTTTVILTESFTISGIAIFSYIILRISSNTAAPRHSITAPLLLTILILLRPFNICFIPILIVNIISARMRTKIFRYAIKSSTACAIVLLSYCILFNIEYGKFSLSSVTSINHAFIYGTSPDFLRLKTLSLESNGSTQEIEYWQIQYPHKSLDEADSLYHHRIMKFATSRITQFDISTDDYFPQHFNPLCYTYFSPIQCVSLAQIYLILIIISLYYICIFFRYRRKSPTMAILLLMCFLTIFTALWGGNNSAYSRLMMPMFPPLCLLLAGFIDDLGLRLNIGKSQK